MTVQDSLDSFMFMKFAKECPGLLGGGVTRTDIDLIFTKARPKFERRLSFEHFLDALSAISERKHPDFPPAEGLRLLIANHLVPHYDLVTHEMEKTGEDVVPLAGIYKRLYDVRNYTGVYAERFRSGDGRINGESDNRAGKRFTGMTNQRTDEIIHDISVLMRPDLKSGTMGRKGRSGSPSRSSTPGRRSRSKGRASSRGRSTRRPASSGGATRGGVDKRAQDELMASIAAAQASGDTTALASTIMALAGKLQEEEGGSGGGGSAAEAAAEIDELYADIEHFTGQLETTTDPTAVRDLQLAIRDRSARISKLQASMGSRGGGAGGARGGGSGRRGAPTPAYATSTNSVGQLVLTDVESLPKLSQVQIQDIFHFYCNF
ncbi:TPPP2, partial [Symbiodinium sp. KB8]